MEIDNGMSISLPRQFEDGPQEEIQLTRQETVVFMSLSAGASNSELAEKLSLAVGTVKFHVSNIREKLGGLSRLQVCLLSALAQNESAEDCETLSDGGAAACRR